MRIKIFAILLLMCISLNVCTYAAEPYTPYTPEFMSRDGKLTPSSWQTVCISGKLSTDMLPVRPTMKIYMVRDSLLRAQLSVPILGEMARAEATPSTLRLYNKGGKVYFEKSLDEVSKAMGQNVSLGNIQDLLLGRPFTPGYPEFNCTVEDLEYDTSQDAWWLKYEYPEFNVSTALMLDTEGRILYALCARFLHDMTASDANPETSAVIGFSYPGRKTRIEFELTSGNKLTQVTYEYGAPDWTPSPIRPLNINNGWRRVNTFREFVKSF